MVDGKMENPKRGQLEAPVVESDKLPHSIQI